MGTDPLPLDEAAARALRRNHSNAHHRAAQERTAQCLDARIKVAAFRPRRVVGRAFTLRFVPVREDLATPESWSAPISTRAAIEEMPSACVVVVDAMGVTDAGIFGDILCARMKKRGVAALITDGTVRDVAGVLGTDLPVWCSGVAAPPQSPGSRSWVGSSRSAVAVWLSSRMTWWWPMTTARC